MSRSIEQLDSMEAIYSLYLVGQPHGVGLDLDDPESVREVVTDALCIAIGPEVTKELMDGLSNEQDAAAVARACLKIAKEEPDLIADKGAPQRIDALLENPPRTDQADLGASLAMVALAGTAMFLMGSFEYERVEEEAAGGRRKKAIHFRFKGSDKVAEFATRCLEELQKLKKLGL
ncbi:MAG TPA: hypothetical protein VGQ93_15920 [Lysobacter sp.]|jgi:hypothetical protein|nr:hypothetical protein [Lysobacter sp.]